MNDSKKTRCYQCGRIQNDDEGLWLLCQNCVTFRCPSCYGSPFAAAECPGCVDRDERRALVECITETRLKANGSSQTG